MAKGDRYVKVVECSDEEKCFIGTCPQMMYGGSYRDDATKVFVELCKLVEEAIEMLEEAGKSLPHGIGECYSIPTESQVLKIHFPKSAPVSAQTIPLGGHPLKKKDPAGDRRGRELNHSRATPRVVKAGERKGGGKRRRAG